MVNTTFKIAMTVTKIRTLFLQVNDSKARSTIWKLSIHIYFQTKLLLIEVRGFFGCRYSNSIVFRIYMLYLETYHNKMAWQALQ